MTTAEWIADLARASDGTISEPQARAAARYHNLESELIAEYGGTMPARVDAGELIIWLGL